MKILILNGPNLNLLGTREPNIYGTTSMEACCAQLCANFPSISLVYDQNNSEGALIDRLQLAAKDGTFGVVFNAGAYTHTSLALADCIRAIGLPVVEVHISNVAAREPIRRQSLIAEACAGTITGFGIDVYRLGIEALLSLKQTITTQSE